MPKSRRDSSRRRLLVEEFEPRLVMAVDGVAISGIVFQAVDTANPTNIAPNPGTPVAGVAVVLDGDVDNPQITNAAGQYSFPNVAAGSHTVSVQLPSDYWGFSNQGLSYTVNVDATAFENLNFALTDTTTALVQNLYQRVLIRSSDVGGLDVWTTALENGSATGGQAFSSFVGSAEFQAMVAPIATALVGFFPGQPVDTGLLRNAIQIGRAGITPDANMLDLLYSQPFLAEFGDTSLKTNTEFVTFLYQTLLDRAPDADGLAYWVGALTQATEPLNRGQVTLGFTGSAEFAQKNPSAGNQVTVSMAYLGLLGRTADSAGFAAWVNFLNAGNSVAALGNGILASSEFAELEGFSDVFLSDIASFQIESPVAPLNRLQKYNPSKFAFDTAVTAGSLTGLTGSNPANVYVISHGWAPGYLQDVLIRSTPGKPLTWWDTVTHPGGFAPGAPDSPWVFQGVNQVSVEGLAQSIVDADPNAQVILFSWIDNSGTPGGGSFSLQNAGSLEESVPYTSDSEAYTQLNGVRMAEAIKQALGDDFFTNQGLLHLMGHSHGTRVATVAALTLQTQDVPVTQLTVFESPEAGPVLLDANITGEGNARNFLWYYLQQMNLSRTPLVGDTRTPNGSTFVDNYYSISGVGMPFATFPGLGSVVDVEMNPLFIYDETGPLGEAFGSHDYPPPWYGQASLASPLSPIATTMTGAGITSVDTTATVTVASTTGFPSSGQDGFFIQVDGEIMQVTSGAGTSTWTLGGRGLFGTTPAVHTNLASAVTLTQKNALGWSPLIDSTVAPTLANGYVQSWSSYNFNQQFVLSPAPSTPNPLPAPVPVQYATQYEVGNVTNTGSSITLSADADDPLALAVVTFTPISQSVGSQAGSRGSGLSFEFEFTNPGEGDQLVVWERGLYGLSAPNAPGGAVNLGTLGYRTVPLFIMTGEDAGSGTQKAILNLDAYFNNTAVDPIALGIFYGTQLPTFGFSLIHAGGSSSTVTISNMQQLNDGTGP